jgi:hypothetical protein
MTGKPELPALVGRYLERALPGGAALPRQVQIGQVGEMWQKQGGRPLRFEAVETLAVAEVAFSWRARFPIAPLVWLRVVDQYAAGEGLLEARLWGRVPVMAKRGGQMDSGEALRYLAELPLVPQAILANRQLAWQEVDAQTVEVATRVGAARVAARLLFDANGDIVASGADARPRVEGKRIVPRPWSGSFGEYAIVGGIRIPTRGEVRWELPNGPFTYWRGTVTSLELDSSRFDVAAQR